jgi:hypothetical protein
VTSRDLGRVHRVREAERDLPKGLRGAGVRARRAFCSTDEFRPNLLLLGTPARRQDFRSSGVVPEARLERPGVTVRAQFVLVPAIIVDNDLTAGVAALHDLPQCQRVSPTADEGTD